MLFTLLAQDQGRRNMKGTSLLGYLPSRKKSQAHLPCWGKAFWKVASNQESINAR